MLNEVVVMLNARLSPSGWWILYASVAVALFATMWKAFGASF